MKTMILVLLASVAFSAFSPQQETVEGIWMGAFRSEIEHENIVVKFVSDQDIEIYMGEVEEENRITGIYRLQGDTALVITYLHHGQPVKMVGSINKRKNFVEGNYEEAGREKGEFFLRKHRIQEMFVKAERPRKAYSLARTS